MNNGSPRKARALVSGIFVFCCVLTMVASGIAASVPSLQWKRLHEEADRRTLDENYSLPRTLPQLGSVDDYYIFGLMCLNRYNDSLAQEAFSAAAALRPGLPEVRWAQAELLRRKHKLTEAVPILTDLIRDYPDYSPPYLTLAYIKYIQLDFGACERLALQVIRQGPKNVDISNYARAYVIYAGAKGVLAYYGGPFSKVINGSQILSNLRRAERLRSQCPSVWWGYGSYYLLSPAFLGRDLDKAKEYFERTITFEPLFADAYVRLGQVYQLRGDVKTFHAYLDKALEIDPRNELALDIKSGSCNFICVDKEKD